MDCASQPAATLTGAQLPIFRPRPALFSAGSCVTLPDVRAHDTERPRSAAFEPRTNTLNAVLLREHTLAMLERTEQCRRGSLFMCLPAVSCKLMWIGFAVPVLLCPTVATIDAPRPSAAYVNAPALHNARGCALRRIGPLRRLGLSPATVPQEEAGVAMRAGCAEGAADSGDQQGG